MQASPPTIERDSTYPNCGVVKRVVYVGGRSRSELLEELKRIGVEINELGFKLLLSETFKISETRRSLVTVELTVRQLGCPQGARILELYGRATSLGLSLCPVELGAFLRCQYLDQPEGFWGQPSPEHRAPPGSVTIASAPLASDDDFPKGFYLRRIKGVLWLRGYQSSAEHVYDAEDHFIFCEP
jgi:hypothetical protein